MIKILFVCHGNICRSPMAEFVMKDMAAKAGVGERFVIDSAATSTEELGNPVYPPAQRELAAQTEMPARTVPVRIRKTRQIGKAQRSQEVWAVKQTFRMWIAVRRDCAAVSMIRLW